MNDEIAVTFAVEQLRVAGTDPSKQVPALVKLGEWYLNKASETTAHGADFSDFTKAVALYNAALVRSRLVNHEIDEEQILQRIVEAYCGFLYAFTHEKPEIAADEIRNEIDFHKEFLANERRMLKERLSDIDSRFNRNDKTEDQYEVHANEMHDIFRDIQDMYIGLVSMLAKECEGRLGQPPCRYALIALGSVARMEATPFSDLEFAILYADPAIGDQVSYFRVLSHFFHLKVINLGETIVPALGIEQLNDFESSNPNGDWFYDSTTPRGISFDGAMPWASKTPLGRKATKKKPALELIGAPEQMAKLQDEEIALKEGYHLADVMSRVISLYGDQTVVDDYNERVAEKLNTRLFAAEGKSSSMVGLKRGMQQLLHDIAIYDPYDCWLGEHSNIGALFNAKKEFYRLISLLLSDLGLIFGIRSPSPWQIISELQTLGIIGESETANIKVCLSIANEIRLRTYFANDGQKEFFSPIPRYENTTERSSANTPFYPGFTEDVVVRLLSTSFDTCLRCQRFCERYSKMNELDISILTDPTIQFSKASLAGHLYFRLQNFPKALESLESVSEESPDYPSSIYGQGLIYLHRGECEKSVECLEKAVEAHKQNEETSNLNVLQVLKSLAMALVRIGDHAKARIRLEEAISKHNEIYGEGSETIYLCSLTRRLNSVYAHLGLVDDLLLAFQNVEEMQNRLTGVPDSEMISLDFEMAFSLTEMGQHSQALQYLKKSLHLGHKVFGKQTSSIELASMYMGAGTVYEQCNRNDEALSWYEQSLETFRDVFGENPHQGKIICLKQLGELQSRKFETNKAVENLKNALKEARTLYHGKPHKLLVLILMSLGETLKKAKKLQESLRYFQEAKKLMDEIHGPIYTDPLTAKIFYSLGTIHDKLGHLAKALQCHQDALNLYAEIHIKDDANQNVAMVISEVACVSHRMGNFIQAKKYFTEAVKMFGKFPLTEHTCSAIVAQRFRLSSICEVLGEHEEALKHLEEARGVAEVIGFEHAMVLDVLHRLGRKYNDLGSFAKFVICFEEFTKMAESVPQNDSMPPYLSKLIELLNNDASKFLNMSNTQQH